MAKWRCTICGEIVEGDRPEKCPLCKAPGEKFEEIVETEGITVSDEDIAAEFEAMAKQYELEVDKIKGMVPTEEVKTSLETRKAVKVLVENAVPVAPKAKEETKE